MSAGDWLVTPFLSGPDGAKGYKPVEVKTAMSATAAGFNPAVSSPTGDLWLDAVQPDAGVTPYVVEPGQTATIPVTIDPLAADGTTVTGTSIWTTRVTPCAAAGPKC